MATSEHVAGYEQDFASGDFTAFCSCGWESHSREKFHTSAEALNEWENHCDNVFMEATERHAEVRP